MWFFFAWLTNYITCNLYEAGRGVFQSARAVLPNWIAHMNYLNVLINGKFWFNGPAFFNKPPNEADVAGPRTHLRAARSR